MAIQHHKTTLKCFANIPSETLEVWLIFKCKENYMNGTSFSKYATLSLKKAIRSTLEEKSRCGLTSLCRDAMFLVETLDQVLFAGSMSPHLIPWTSHFLPSGLRLSLSNTPATIREAAPGRAQLHVENAYLPAIDITTDAAFLLVPAVK